MLEDCVHTAYERKQPIHEYQVSKNTEANLMMATTGNGIT